MADAFSGWTAAAPYPVQVPSGEGTRQDRVLVSPALVVTLDADHRMLVVSGVPDDGHGQPEQFHATAVNIGLYGFERRAGRWVKTFERASFAWTGAYGVAGELGVHALAAGRTALSMENGYCGQGYCSQRLQVFALSPRGAKLLTEQMIGGNATDATLGCAEWLSGKPLAEADKPDPMTPANCYDVRSKWQFEKADGDAWPDLVVTFTGTQAVEDSRTGQTAPRVVDEQLVLRHDGNGYKTLRGRNPMQ